MGNNKGKVQVKAKVKAKKKKAVKPTLGKGSGGFLSARIVATVKQKQNNNGQSNSKT